MQEYSRRVAPPDSKERGHGSSVAQDPPRLHPIGLFFCLLLFQMLLNKTVILRIALSQVSHPSEYIRPDVPTPEIAASWSNA